MIELAIKHAASLVRNGGVIAYPTEYCFGLGCDPFQQNAVRRILRLKQRSWSKGLVIIAQHVAQLRPLVDFSQIEDVDLLIARWPRSQTYLLPALPRVPSWIRGQHDTIAVRITDHKSAAKLCRYSRSALVSTSANRSGRPPLRHYRQIQLDFGDELDFVVEAKVGAADAPSLIRDFRSGELVRG
ncbi:MAG: Sua5/YciO/YrdC/YwlC family protein [Pseudomonadota bacterium]|nr:Sua5/YciO/YrdC/YwlC family protein [Pseudomonadota bacterium]